MSKWESAQTVPDAVTIARLCEALDVSADYLLLGKEPNKSGSASSLVCPLCRTDRLWEYLPSMRLCAGLSRDDNGRRYALVTTDVPISSSNYEVDLVKYCGLSAEAARELLKNAREAHRRAILRRNLKKQEVRYLAAHAAGIRFANCGGSRTKARGATGVRGRHGTAGNRVCVHPEKRHRLLGRGRRRDRWRC